MPSCVPGAVPWCAWQVSGRRLGLQRASRARRIVPAPPIRARRPSTPSIRFPARNSERPDHHDQPEYEDIVQGGCDRDGVYQVGGD